MERKFLILLNKMSERKNLYLGRAGQMAVMAEFLVRGWNAAIPEVDVGDDIFVVRDSDGNLSRIQVKTASSSVRKYGYSAQFNVSLSQLKSPITPELAYVFTVRHNNKWDSFVVIDRSDLFEEHQIHNIGSTTRNNLILTFQYSKNRVTCSNKDITHYFNNWNKWPPIYHNK